jgi:PKD repeat protein
MRTILLALFVAIAQNSISQYYHCAAIDFQPTDNYYTLSPLSLLPENAGGTAVYTLTYGNGETTTVESTEMILNPAQLALIADFGADLCFTWGEQNEICSIPVCYLLNYIDNQLIVYLADYPCEIHVEYTWLDDNTISIINESIIGANADSAVYLVVINGQVFADFPVVYTYDLNEETAFSVLMETFAEGNTVCQKSETIEPVQPINECATMLSYTETGCNSFLFSLDGLPLDAYVNWWVGPENDEDFSNSSSTLAYTFENPGIYRVVAQVMGGYDLNCESYFFEIETLIADCVPEGCPQISMTSVNCSTYLFEAIGAEDGSLSVSSGPNMVSENDPSVEYTFCFPYSSWYQFLDATYTGTGCEQGVTFEFEQLVELCLDYPTISYNNPGDCSDLNYTLTLENIPQEIITTWWTIYQFVDGNFVVLDYFEGESMIEYTFPQSGAYMAYAYAEVLNCGAIETENIPINVCSEMCPTQMSAEEVSCNYYEFNIANSVIPNTVSWNFGDGTEEISYQGTEHYYSENGTYVITANYISEYCPEGVVLETSVTISCMDECPQTISTEPTGVCTEVGFYLGSGNNPEAEVIWYFDDAPGIAFGDFLFWGWGDDDAVVHDVCAYYESPQCPGGVELCIEYSQNCTDSCLWQFDYQHIACGYYHLFNADSLEPGTTYFVDWGDGTTNTTGNFDTHVYTASGIYELCVTRTNEECGPITYCELIEVDACDGNCTLEIETSQEEGFNYVFNATGNPADLPLYWTVNNGTPIEGDDPFEINLNGYGVFTVCAWYETVGCGIVEDCIEITISDSLCPNEITITSESLCHQFTFEVNNWGESQFGNIYWDFGDTEGYGMNEFLHMYAEPGVYTVCAEGTTEACPGGFYLCTELVVEACGGNEDGCPEFIWSTMIDDCGHWHFEAGIPTSNENATIIWDFGDGTSTTDFNTIADHQYTADGIYTVTVNIQLYGNDCAPTIFLETTITVNVCEINLCDIDIFSMAGDSCSVMIFEAGSFVEGEAFIWYFGDGTTEEGGHYIEHTYAEPGIYNVYCVFSNALCQGWQESTTITVDDCITTCSDVFVTLFSDVTNGGPETAFWNISTLDMEPVANGVIEFTDQNPYIDFAYCLDDGCYMLTLEGLGVGMTDLFEPGVQMNGLSVVQELNTFNDNLIEIVFGVNSNCVENCSQSSVEVNLNNSENELDLSFTIIESTNNTIVHSGNGIATENTNYANDFCLPDGCYEIHYAFDLDAVPGSEIIYNLTVNNQNAIEDDNVLYNTGATVAYWFGVNTDCSDAVVDTNPTTFNVFPNPANDLLKISGPTGIIPYLIEIMDATGRLVYSSTNSNVLDVSHLANGTYFVRASTKGYTACLPLIIRH